MEIRALVESDGEAWWHLRLESLENDPLAFGKSAAEHRASTVDDARARFRDTPADSFHLGAFAEGRLIGMATFIRDTGLQDRHKGHVYGVYVTPEYRRMGVARALMETLIERARRDASLEQILLAVTTPNDAAGELYRRLGFTVYGTEPRALKIGSTYIDERMMILRLS